MLARLTLLSFALVVVACGTTSELRERSKDASSAHDAAAAGDASSDRDARGASAASGLEAGVSDAHLGDASRDAESTMSAGDARASDAGGATSAERESFVYVGGSDWSGEPFPFRSYRLDRGTGTLTPLQASVDLGLNPSYATPSASGRFLYVANEDERAPGVTVASIDPLDGHVTKLEQRPFTGGGGFVFTSLDPSGKYLLAADHNGGRAVVYPVRSDGKLAAPSDTESFASGAHTHSIRTDPSGKWAYVPNKDLHSVAQFSLDAASGKLTALAPATVAAPGGPRHIAFTPDGRFAFVILEYDDKVNAYALGGDGTLTQVDSQSSLPAGFSGENTGAHVLVHPNGKFLYASNRGHNSIVVFAIDGAGKLALVQHAPTLGKTPRNFDVDATGELLVVANQGDDNANNGSLVVFAIGRDGKLAQRGSAVPGLRSPNAVAIVTRAPSVLALAP